MRSTGKSITALKLGTVAALASIVPAGNAADTGGALLSSLKPGEWTVRFRDGGETRKICVRNGTELVQLKHPRPGCSRVVTDSVPDHLTIQYKCPGDGYGRTTIRRETTTLVQVTGQGIKRGLPFDFDAEARRTGNCQ